MLDWRHVIIDIKKEINLAKSSGISMVPIAKLEAIIDDIEDIYQIEDKFEILNIINSDSNKKHDAAVHYEKILNAYSKYSKERMHEQKLYAQVLISSVYIGFFGLWNLSHFYLEVNDKLASFTLLLISIVSFTFLEVMKVALVGYSITIKSKALLRAKAADEIEDKLDALEKDYHYERWSEIWLARFWPWSYSLSVVTGLFAIAILMKSYIQTLF